MASVAFLEPVDVNFEWSFGTGATLHSFYHRQQTFSGANECSSSFADIQYSRGNQEGCFACGLNLDCGLLPGTGTGAKSSTEKGRLAHVEVA